MHQVAMGTPSHVPLQRHALIIAIFRGFWDQFNGPLRLGLGTEVRLWSYFQIYLTREFYSFLATCLHYAISTQRDVC